MAHCHNCGQEMQRGMKFCPNCGQDQSVVVPQDQRISPEDVSQSTSTPPPPLFNAGQGGGGDSRQESSGPLSGISRKWRIGLLGCGGVGLLLLALIVVGIVSGASNNTAQSGGGGKQEESGEDKKKTGSDVKKKGGADKAGQQQIAVGETAELDDRTFAVAEVERNYVPQNRYSKAEAGSEFLRVWITLTNTSNRAISYNPFDFQVQDSNGILKRTTFMSEVPYNIDSGELAPEGTVEGNMIFEVPQNDNDLKLLYETNAFRGETITVEPLQ